jgi:hypothetical protein
MLIQSTQLWEASLPVIVADRLAGWLAQLSFLVMAPHHTPTHISVTNLFSTVAFTLCTPFLHPVFLPPPITKNLGPHLASKADFSFWGFLGFIYKGYFKI